jgi:signal transduction histidine kinase
LNFRVNARTVLELGSELISSDIIAFYELIKNAFDAGSKNGADIRFRIAMRRNDYVRLRDDASAVLRLKASKTERTEQLTDLIARAKAKINPSVGGDAAGKFGAAIGAASDLEDFIGLLDACYDEHNSIEISDAGSGMTISEITNNFLTLGTPARKREVDRILSQGGSKTPLGEKGIGRLSAMRLGHLLKMETARAEDSHWNLLDIDWRAFEDLDLMIEDIKIVPRKGARKTNAKAHGTSLILGGLLEDWTEKRLRQFADYEFARLTDPFLDPKARPRIALFWNDDRIAIPWLDPALIENAHASLTGTYTVKAGEPRLDLNMVATKLGNFEHPRETDTLTLTLPDLEGLLKGNDNLVPESALTSVGDFDFEIYWFNRRYLTGIEGLGKQPVVRALVKKWSSIMLFRDGFRVFPYGEVEDDWLGLDAVALGRTGYVLNKNQFIGHVRISRARNPKLVDQTNREGLRQTPESQVFEEVLHDAVAERLWSFFKYVDERYRKRVEPFDDIGKEIGGLEGRAKAALGKLRRHVPREDMETFTDLEHTLREFHELSSRAQHRIEEIEADSRQMVQMAGVGLLVEMVAHELARSTESALASLEGLRGKDLPQEVKARLDTLRAEIKSISKRLRVLDEASVPGRQRAETFDLVQLVEDLKDGHAAQFKRHHIEMKIKAPKGSLKVKLVKGMVVQILENLLANSIYWMKIRADREASYRPAIDIRIEADPLTIRFSDNGRGIAPDHRERVFRAYWSLKEKSKRRGLGLFIAASNAEDLKGKLTLSEKADRQTGRLHEFVLELPDAAVIR